MVSENKDVKRKKRCKECGGEFWVGFFRNNKVGHTRMTRTRCKRCEQERRDAYKQKRRCRVKAGHCLRSHSRKLGLDLAADFGWNIDQMEHDIEHAAKNGCPYCHQLFAEMNGGLSAITLDIIDPEQPPVYGTNTRWCCATCNKEKQRLKAWEFGLNQLCQRQWEENKKLREKDPYGDLPLFRQAKNLFIAILLTILAATATTTAQDTSNVVRVQCGSSIGSGVYLGDRLILTASHIFDGERTAAASIRFPSGELHTGKLVARDQSWDQACVELSTAPQTTGAKLASANPEYGDQVVAAGYDWGRTLRLRRGQVVAFHAQVTQHGILDWFAMSNPVVDGCSGGPVFNSSGEVIGNLWGASVRDGTTVALMCGRTRRFLLPWNARLEAYWLFLKNRPTQSDPAVAPSGWGGNAGSVCRPDSRPVYQAPATTLPPSRPTPVPTQPTLTIDSIVAKLKADPEFMAAVRGPEGKQGPPGKDGEVGPPGSAAQIDVQAVAQAIRQALPPITVATTDAAGQQIILGEAYLGDTVTLPPITFRGLSPSGQVQDTETVPLGGRLNIQYPGLREKAGTPMKDYLRGKLGIEAGGTNANR